MMQRLPLTYQQLWLWELTRRYDRWHCAATYIYRLCGVLDVTLLRRAFAVVTGAHTSLRMRIVVDAGMPQQEIADDLAWSLEFRSISGETSAQIGARARLAVEEFCDQRMDPAGPLLRAVLFELSGQDHWLVLSLHRLGGDCACIDQVCRETLACYAELVQGNQLARPSYPQYADYTIWQVRNSPAWEQRHASYWSQRLSAASPIRWPATANAPAVASAALGKASCLLEAPLSAQLHELARRARTLAATLMMTIYVAVLRSWCGQDDFILPCNIAGRQAEHKAVVGFFSYALYLRIQLTGRESFRELLSRLGNEFFQSLSHQDFGRMVRQHPELLSGTLFQWMTWHPQDSADAVIAGKTDSPALAVERIPIRDFGEGLTLVPPGMTALEITFFDTSEGIHASASYCADRFTARTMDRFMADLHATAQRLVGDPDSPVVAVAAGEGGFDGTTGHSSSASS